MAELKGKRRQIFRDQFYKSRLCNYFPDYTCPRGKDCPFAHGAAELRETPDLAKTSLCKKWLCGQCTLPAAKCQFAHGKRELHLTSAFAQHASEQGRQRPGTASKTPQQSAAGLSKKWPPNSPGCGGTSSTRPGSPGTQLASAGMAPLCEGLVGVSQNAEEEQDLAGRLHEAALDSMPSVLQGLQEHLVDPQRSEVDRSLVQVLTALRTEHLACLSEFGARQALRDLRAPTYIPWFARECQSFSV